MAQFFRNMSAIGGEHGWRRSTLLDASARNPPEFIAQALEKLFIVREQQGGAPRAPELLQLESSLRAFETRQQVEPMMNRQLTCADYTRVAVLLEKSLRRPKDSIDGPIGQRKLVPVQTNQHRRTAALAQRAMCSSRPPS